MRARAELFWRLLPDVRTGERTRFLFFAGLFTLINVAQTVGLAGSEALLLGKLGAGALPVTFIVASLATVLGPSSMRSAGRLRNDDSRPPCSRSRCAASAASVLAGYSAVLSRGLPALLTQAIFTNTSDFSGDYFDTLASNAGAALTVGASLGGRWAAHHGRRPPPAAVRVSDAWAVLLAASR